MQQVEATWARWPAETEGHMSTKDRTKDKIDLAAVKAKTAIHNESDKVSHAATNVGEKVKDAASTVGEKVKDAASTVGEKIKDAGAAVKDAGHDIKRKIEH
ncbi:MAG TPA: Synuclein [Thermoanaerobaculia bacterium]